MPPVNHLIDLPLLSCVTNLQGSLTGVVQGTLICRHLGVQEYPICFPALLGFGKEHAIEFLWCLFRNVYRGTKEMYSLDDKALSFARALMVCACHCCCYVQAVTVRPTKPARKPAPHHVCAPTGNPGAYALPGLLTRKVASHLCLRLSGGFGSTSH
jgi:hypothetical protein